MAALEAFVGRAPRVSIGARIREHLPTVSFVQRRQLPTYTADEVAAKLGPYANHRSSFAQEMTDARQGDGPDIRSLATSTLVNTVARLAVTAGAIGAIWLLTGCTPHVVPDGGHVPTDGGTPTGGEPTPDPSVLIKSYCDVNNLTHEVYPECPPAPTPAAN